MIRTRHPLSLFLLLLTVASCWPAVGAAQEGIQWRYDYAKARKEAREKGLPLILDFGYPACIWCVRLEKLTFSDPAVSKAMNTQFIPLKINVHQDPTLGQKLQVTTYPTLVFADSDGRILGTMEGFKTAEPFREILKRTLARVENPGWMQRDYRLASKSFDSRDYGKAIPILRQILDDGKSRPIQRKAKVLLTTIENQATGILTRSKNSIDLGNSEDAIAKLTGLINNYPGTPAARHASTLITTVARPNRKIARKNRAQELFQLAKQDYARGDVLAALERCDLLNTEYEDFKEAKEATELASTIRSNPAKMKLACEKLNARLRKMYCELAESYMEKNDRQRAVAYYQKVRTNFPGTRESEIAALRIGQLTNQPTRVVDYNKSMEDDK
ncbi:MAG: DUF255 domain-containing protein [Gemmataceae bacterium]